MGFSLAILGNLKCFECRDHFKHFPDSHVSMEGTGGESVPRTHARPFNSNSWSRSLLLTQRSIEAQISRTSSALMNRTDALKIKIESLEHRLNVSITEFKETMNRVRNVKQQIIFSSHSTHVLAYAFRLESHFSKKKEVAKM